jgi:carboxypeptidase Q
MLRRTAFLLSLAAFTLTAFPFAQTEKLDYAAIGQIRDEGLSRSQAMETLFWLTDRYGPRVTGSPGMEEAGAWTMKKMTEWGLSNVHREEFDFGRSWSIVRFSAHMIEPRVQPLIGLPKTWSPPTGGPVTAEVVRVTIATDADLAKYKGQLEGKIVLPQPARAVRMLEGPFIVRMDGNLAREAETTPVPAQRGRGQAASPAAGGRAVAAEETPGDPPAGGGRGSTGSPQGGNQQFLARVQQFYRDEGVVAVLDRGSDADTANMGSNLSVNQQRPDGGTVFPGTVNRTAAAGVPQVTLAVEHYNRMVRLLEHNVPVKVELDVRVEFHENTKGFNIVGDIPGTDLAGEVVLLGAHFDSHSFATGATDNATGSTAMLEALRIIKALGFRPRRTIRVALWGGEEQGLLGSKAYVKEHFGTFENPKPEFQKFAGYFNVDSGTGRIRGASVFGPPEAGTILREAFAPFEDLGIMGALATNSRRSGGTDSTSFNEAGLPGIGLSQDPIEYNSYTWHTNLDTYERIIEDDVKKSATAIAAALYHLAMRDEMLPRFPKDKMPASPAPPRAGSGSGQ